MSLETIRRLESEVRGYCRSFPTTFATARGATMTDTEGREYLDFFAGAGALNYGHNPPSLQKALVDYLSGDGVVHSLDLVTEAKARFLERFDEIVLRPRGLDYRVQFPGPTGTNAVEAALKLARKVTGRQRVLYFTNGFHGMTLGSLAVTGNSTKRAGAGVGLPETTPVPYDGYLGDEIDSLTVLRTMLEDSSSGIDRPAAVIVETIQAEGGVNVASPEWLRELAALLREHGVLLIVDDIQVGCGRTGPFFSFEPAGIEPDIVCLSKSLSGFGLPFAVVLIKPEHDVWAPGEHNGTFRGHNPAFVTATAALRFWEDDALSRHVVELGAVARERLEALGRRHPEVVRGVRGAGLILGMELREGLADRVSAECFERGLILETAGPGDEVLKLLPPLTLTREELDRGLDVIERSLEAVLEETGGASGDSESTLQVA